MADRLKTNPIYIDQFYIWQTAVINFWDASAALPVGPNVGDRYICSVAGTGWTKDNIYQWGGAVWAESVATANWGVYVTNENKDYIYGTAWTEYSRPVLAAKGSPLHISKIIFLSAAANDIFKLEDNEGNVIAHVVNNNGNADTTTLDFDPPLACRNGVYIDGSDCTGLAAQDGTDAVWIYLT